MPKRFTSFKHIKFMFYIFTWGYFILNLYSSTELVWLTFHFPHSTGTQVVDDIVSDRGKGKLE